MPTIAVTENADGDLFAGFDVDGVFIPFASVSSNRVVQLQDRARELKELAKEEGESSSNRHAEAANALPYDAPKAKAKAAKSKDDSATETDDSAPKAKAKAAKSKDDSATETDDSATETDEGGEA